MPLFHTPEPIPATALLNLPPEIGGGEIGRGTLLRRGDLQDDSAPPARLAGAPASQPPLSDLAHRNDELASQAARVSELLPKLPGYLNRMVQAADCNDWQSIHKLGRALADGSAAAGARELTGAAEQLVIASKTGHNAAAVRRTLLRLIGVSGRMRRSVAQQG